MAGIARTVRDSRGWFTRGAEAKALARSESRCVECHGPLPVRARMYCSDACRWRYHGRFFWDAARVVVFRRDRYTCRNCRKRYRRRELEVDHIVELARGGPELEYWNLQTLCRRCHRQKTSTFNRSRARSPARADPGPAAAGEAAGTDWFPA